MKILHLFSDWKWTGPAEPALEMVKGLRQQGVDAHFAVSPLPFEAEDTVRKKALAAGVPLTEDFALRKHFHLWHNFSDIRKLMVYVKEHNFDLIHCHRQQDHLIGAKVAEKCGVPLVRSSHDGRGLKNDWRNRYLMKKATTLYLPVSEMAANEDQQTFSMDPTKIQVLPPAIDTEHFDPSTNFKDMRSEKNIPQDKIVIGIVARMQRHRHFEDLLDSWVRVKEARDDVHFVIVGRGTNMDEVAVQPAKDRGLNDVLTFAGYHRETYTDMLNAFDIKMFLVPGSDGSCRALRQALSLGIPAISSSRGMLAEIVLEGENGFVTDGSPETLAAAQIKLCESVSLRKQMSATARRLSVEKYSLIAQSKKLIMCYEKLIK